MKLHNLGKLRGKRKPTGWNPWAWGMTVLVLCSTATAQQPQDAVMKETATKLTQVLHGFQDEHLAWFVPEFFQSVPKDRLIAGLKRSGEGLGEIARSRVVRHTEAHGADLEFISKSRRRLHVTVRVEPKPPHRITYLMFHHLDLGQDSWDSLLFDVQKFPGQTAASVWRLTPRSKLLLSHNGDVPLAVGSSFKLMLLATLADEIAAGKRQWADVVKIQDAYRSLPSGMLHDWPAGSPLTLHTLATLMIARSDNTAADHLFHALGRDAIEAHQVKAKVQAPERNRPFLNTSELFKLKLVQPAEKLKHYAAAPVQDRRKLVDALTNVPLASPRSLTSPLMIDQVEWFFTSDDLCRLLDQMRQSKASPQVLPLLRIARPLELDEHEWEYLGFKGGAEAGVLNLSLLGKRKGGGDWFAFSFTWNRPDQVLDEPSWLRQLDRAVRLAEREQ